VSSDLVDIVLLSLVATINPTLFAAVTVMLLLPHPRRLMLGYLLGAYATSITLGLLIVFVLHGSGAESTSKHTISPLEDILVGVLALGVAFVLRTGRDRPFEERRRAKKDAKSRTRRKAGKPTESLPMRLLKRGNPRVTFVAGAMLSFPGVSYLDALDHIHKLSAGDSRDSSAGHLLLPDAAAPPRSAAARLRLRARAHPQNGQRIQGVDGTQRSHRRRHRCHRDRRLAGRQRRDQPGVRRHRLAIASEVRPTVAMATALLEGFGGGSLPPFERQLAEQRQASADQQTCHVDTEDQQRAGGL
jgi:hypothetical protein